MELSCIKFVSQKRVAITLDAEFVTVSAHSRPTLVIGDKLRVIKYSIAQNIPTTAENHAHAVTDHFILIRNASQFCWDIRGTNRSRDHLF